MSDDMTRELERNGEDHSDGERQIAVTAHSGRNPERNNRSAKIDCDIAGADAVCAKRADFDSA